MEETEIQKTEEVVEEKQTKKELFWEFSRFLLVGSGATVVDWGIAYAFYTWILPPSLIGDVWALIISTALGFCCGLIMNWLLSVSFVFRKVKDEKEVRSKKSFLTFTAIGLFGLLISELGMQLVPILPEFALFGTTKFLGTAWVWWLMKWIMAVIGFVWNYVGRKLFVFKS